MFECGRGDRGELSMRGVADVAGKRLHDRTDDFVHPQWNVASTAVGDRGDPLVECLDVALVAHPGRESGEIRGHLAPSVLARGAQPAAFDIEVCGDSMRDLDHVGRLVMDGERGPSDVGPDRSEPLPRHRCRQARSGEHRRTHPAEHRLRRGGRQVPVSTGLDDVVEPLAEFGFDDAVGVDVAGDGAQQVAGGHCSADRSKPA